MNRVSPPPSRVRRPAAMLCALATVMLVAGAALLSSARPAHAIAVQTIETPAGLTAWLVEDSTNPMVTLRIAFRGGAALDPPGKEGLATMVAALLDEGAGDLDSQGFQRRLADLAIDLDFDAGRDAFTGSLRTLTANLDEAMALLRLAVTQPQFEADAVERIRGQMQAALRRAAADPQEIAQQAWFATLFPDHPYGHDPGGTADSVAGLTADDLRAFTRRQVTRDRLVIGVAGDVDPERLAALVDDTFGDLPATSDQPPVPEAPVHADGTTHVIDRPVPQSVAVFGQPGIDRADPDWYAAYVVNYILGGGGFSSRLMQEVREKRGLAYSVYSYLMPLDHAPIWVGGVATGNARIAKSLALIRQEWRRMAEEGPTAAELDDAITYLTGAWPLRFTSSGAIAGILVAMQQESLPPSYLDTRNDLIRAVTLDDARRVATRLMDPARLTTVVVGQPEDLPAVQ